MGPREVSWLLFFSSRLPSRCVGPRSMEPSLWEPLELGLGSQHPPYLYSWASTCALWAGWPTAQPPTPSFSLRQTVVLVRWA